jgi:delta14-sterol reductase
MPPAKSPARAAKSPARAAKSPAPSRAAAKSPARASRAKSPAAAAAPAVDLKAWQEARLGEKRSGPPAGFEYEFGGVPGACGIMVALPFVIYLLFYGCTKKGYCVQLTPESLAALLPTVVNSLGAADPASLWSWEAAAVVFGWTGLHFLLYLYLPGRVAQGVKLSDGSRLDYHINGHLAFWLSLAACAALPWLIGSGPKGRHPLAWLYDHYLDLIGASMALSMSIAVFSYRASFRRGELLALGGQSGNAIYDFFIGRALNPRVGRLDLKCACELRPGLIGWVVLNLGMAAKQLENEGSVSPPMLAVNAFQMLYVWDALYQEQAILTTMDITTDGFGFMLAFGDLAWVPFTYSLQARLLVDHDPHLSYPALAAITCLNLLGYAIFRGANSQKDAFRRDPKAPEVAHLQYLNTKRGTRLLTSGWWGMARKINYTGDWLMGLSWCLTCGGSTPLAYFYAIYFFVLLVHRSLRDDHACSLKYGDDWAKYKAKVPAIFVPHVW